MTAIKNFIEENNISFEQGSRNTSVVTLIGYAQHLGLSQNALKEELSDQIDADIFIQEEIDRLWDYCKARNYKNWWNTTEAKTQYTF
jgi:hypothetical protein